MILCLLDGLGIRDNTTNTALYLHKDPRCVADGGVGGMAWDDRWEEGRRKLNGARGSPRAL